MTDLAIISGSGFYDFPGLEDREELKIDTKYGTASVTSGRMEGKRISFIARHGQNHDILPNKINYRANLLALKKLRTKAVVSTTVCGVLDSSIPLARLVVFDDIYFPDNRLPDGQICTIFDEIGQKEKGHYLFDKPFSEELRQQLIEAAENSITRASYAHVNGPRFNSKAEINLLKNYASFISQTAGPEVVLAGELEIPCVLLGFGVDYANGISKAPTPVEVLEDNLNKSKDVFIAVLRKLIRKFREPKFGGFIFRFE